MTDWKSYGKALKKALWDNVCVVQDEPGLRCGWMDGGCFVAARAVASIVGGEIWGIWSATPHLQQAEHIVVRTPDAAGFLDADGFADGETMLKRWQKELAHRHDRPAVSLVQLDMVSPAGLDAVACQVGLAEKLERRLRTALPPLPRAARARQHNPIIAEVGFNPSEKTVEELRAVLRGMFMPVGGKRADLDARVARLLATRARFAGRTREELTATMTVAELKDALRSVSLPTSGKKWRLALDLYQLVTRPLQTRDPRKPERLQMAMLWTNPFTGQRELREYVDDRIIPALKERARRDLEIIESANRHGIAVPSPDVTFAPTAGGAPQSSEADMYRFAELIRDLEGRTLPVLGMRLDKAEPWRREDASRQHRLDTLLAQLAPRHGNPVDAAAQRRAIMSSDAPLAHRIRDAARSLAPANKKAHRQTAGWQNAVWDESLMLRALVLSEHHFGVALGKEPLGCGVFGCAWPLRDGRVLKITADPHEITWANIAHAAQRDGDPPPATVPIFMAPVPWRAGKQKPLYAYIRATTKDLPHMFSAPGLQKAVRSAKRWYASRGLQLRDASTSNTGVLGGEFVIRDARAAVEWPDDAGYGYHD